ncbi:MAG: TonB-dependent receptor, partial [Chlorobium sp.]|nr:TonB-dependent receptor [Chlorobium sp.]
IEVSGKADGNKNTTIDRVDAETIREFSRNTVADAANLIPGITSSVTGARNEQTLYVRGFDIKHVPIFLDGIPIYVPYDGYPDLARFTTFDLSELVVSKGFTSVLYGPNTMGGAINMVSRRPEKTFEGNAGAGFSTGDAYNTYLNAGSNQETWYIQTGASYMNSDYVSLSDDFKPTKSEDGGHRNNSYQQDEKVNVKVGLTPNKDDEYAFSYIYQHGEKGTPPYAGKDPSITPRYWQWPYWDKQSYYFSSMTKFDDIGYVKSRLYHDKFKNSLISYDNDSYTTITKGYAFTSNYDDYTNGASLELGSPIIPNNMLKLAMHYKLDVHREKNAATSPVQTFKDQILSMGLEDTITFTDAIYAITGISYDTTKSLDAENLLSGKITDFPMGSTSGTNPQLGFFYQPSKDTTYHISAAQKTRLPSIKDRYSYKLGTAIPNPDLDPEKSINYEIGYETKQIKNVTWKSTVFYNDVTDFIQSMTVPNPSLPGKTLLQNQNIGEVNLYGFESGITAYVFSSLQLGCNYTFTYADNRTDATKLINIPQHKLTPFVKYTLFDSLSVMADIELDSKRYSTSDGKWIAHGFSTANLKFDYDFNNGFIAETGVQNIFDRNYELQEGYPEDGRTFFANVRYKF